MRVVAVGSGSTGSGKTTIAAALALALSERGLRTCAVDLDVSSGDLHLALGGAHTGRGLDAFLSGDAPTLSELARPVPGRADLRLVRGVHDSRRAGAIAAQGIERLLCSIAALDADAVVVEVPASVAPAVLDVLAVADVALVVSLADAESCAAARRAADRARLRAGVRARERSAPRRSRACGSLDEMVRDMGQNAPGAAPRTIPPRVVLNRCAGRPSPMRAEDGLLIAAELPEDPALAACATVPRLVDAFDGSALHHPVALLSELLVPGPAPRRGARESEAASRGRESVR